MKARHIIDILQKFDRFLISTHVNPDPDALASEIALAMYLRGKGKKVAILNEEKVPERFLFMPGVGQIRKFQPGKKNVYDAVIIVDCGDLSRVGKVAQAVREDKPVINIDHHITNQSFGEFNLVDPKASSTCEIVYDLLRKACYPLNRDMAALLYLGIMTDTGSFRYENTTSRTHRFAAELMAFDLSVSEMYRCLYELIPFQDIRSFSRVVDGLKPLVQGQVVCLELTKATLRKFSESFDLRDKIFRYVRAIKGVEVVVILTEKNAKNTRVNFRSHGKVDVARLAFRFNGGGHCRASGCMVEGDMSAARNKVLRAVREVLDK